MNNKIPVEANATDASTPKKPDNTLGSYAEEIRSNASVTGNLNSQFKYMQTDNGPYDEMSKGASMSDNKYLQKIASVRALTKSVGESTPMAKLGLGISAASLGFGSANFFANHKASKANQDKVTIQRKSLSALNNINKSLSTAVIHPSPIAVPKQQSSIK